MLQFTQEVNYLKRGVRMKGKRIVSIGLLLCFFMISTVFAEEIVYTDQEYITWTQAKEKVIEDILFDDVSFLYVKLSGKIVKIDKDFSNDFMAVSRGEEDSILEYIKQRENDLKLVDKDRIKRDGNDLFYGDTKILSIEKYVKEDEKFYEDNPQYEKKEILYNVYLYQLHNEKQLFFIQTYLNRHIPPPYTPWYVDAVLVDEENVHKIDIHPKFYPQRILESEDGSIWIHGSIRYGRYTFQTTLYLLNPESETISLNEKLKVNYIDILGKGKDQVIIYAKNFPAYQSPDLGKYSDENEGFLVVDTKCDVTKRKEEFIRMKSPYVDIEGHIYCVTENGYGLINLTTQQTVRIQENQTDVYEKMQEEWENIEEDIGPQVSRKDMDGSVWYLKNGNIYHKSGDKHYIFEKGLELLTHAVNNIFIDKDGGKWFVAAAGISYLGSDYEEVENINPYIAGGLYPIHPGREDNIYIDGDKRIWYFDEQILCASFKESAVLAEDTKLIEGYKRVSHSYMEIHNKGIFVYQRPVGEENRMYDVRIIQIDREGSIRVFDYRVDKSVRSCFKRKDALYLKLEDGLIKIENDKRYDIRNEELIGEHMHWKWKDDNTVFFKNRYSIVKACIPSFGDIVDTYSASDKEVCINGKKIAAYEVNGKTAICIEDLQYYGYKMVWDQGKRVSTFTYLPPDARGIEGIENGSLISSGAIYYSDV